MILIERKFRTVYLECKLKSLSMLSFWLKIIAGWEFNNENGKWSDKKVRLP